MMNKERHKPGRIPVRFMDEATRGGGDDPLTPEEIGRESSYDDETEVGRRIEQGEAGDDSESLGGPDPSELPERREDQDTNPSHRESNEGAPDAQTRGASPSQHAARSGPELAELIATRSELKRVEAENARLAEERQEIQDMLTRRQADFENYRRRVERERAETYGRAAAEVAAQLLPVVDNLQRALDAEASIQSGESEEFRHFLHGVELIGRQLNGVLENLGVQPVPTVGQPFDPHVHEAVATEESDEYEPDTVTAELVRGYRIGDRLIRPAMVKVAK